jgi:hypothetical protein
VTEIFGWWQLRVIPVYRTLIFYLCQFSVFARVPNLSVLLCNTPKAAFETNLKRWVSLHNYAVTITFYVFRTMAASELTLHKLGELARALQGW